ncbi:hypothetical protein BDC45DRAFT_526399 [Circinella umbellata]|nr:hypothetical protein BDC45DRAFT_526399 [Circinella umbellata]
MVLVGAVLAPADLVAVALVAVELVATVYWPTCPLFAVSCSDNFESKYLGPVEPAVRCCFAFLKRDNFVTTIIGVVGFEEGFVTAVETVLLVEQHFDVEFVHRNFLVEIIVHGHALYSLLP